MARLPWLWLVVLLSACGSDDAELGPGTGGTAGAAGSGGAATGGASGSGGGAGTGGASTTGCGKAAPASGKRTLSHGGAERSYQLHVPPGYDASKPTPVVVNFHGRTAASFGEAAPLQEAVSKLYAKADAAGFLVVNPQGLSDSDGSQTWNAGTCCAEDKTRDDVGFADAILDELDAALCVDKKRIFATGLSNGGFLSHRLACERAERYAAVAPVAAFNGMASCSPSRGISLISFNGTADKLVSYAASQNSNQAWVTRNGCNPTPTETFKKGDSHCDTYSGCKDGAEVVFCTIDDGGHTWPGGMDMSTLGFGKTTQDLIANDAMWELFQKHPLP
ncbi:MAG: hypothetical protein IT377_06100 [Polyangiaceae bacterium]|nr:hypothetical protein [Polyangiaceae bacterium]